MKWTAPEVMFKKSNVFAVFMWEVLSFGGTPYGLDVTSSELKKRMASEFCLAKVPMHSG